MRHTRDTRERLRTLRECFANASRTLADALTTIAGQRLDPWTPTFKTRTLLLRIREIYKGYHKGQYGGHLQKDLSCYCCTLRTVTSAFGFCKKCLFVCFGILHMRTGVESYFILGTLCHHGASHFLHSQQTSTGARKNQMFLDISCGHETMMLDISCIQQPSC